MCGIVGKIAPYAVDAENILFLRDLIRHRGPDDAGLWQSDDRRVVLGHRRLSIIDLSESGHQPMISECGRYVITFNGEIYNYIELKEELEGLGYRFRSTSDTEVILNAYKEWGQGCLELFNGMFAFAIWDRGSEQQSARLFMARDRAGKKPFYYSHRDNSFCFASELKAVPSEMRGGISLQALNHYLALGYVPGALCILEDVHKLPPAHAAVYIPADDTLEIRRWWRLPRMNTDSAMAGGELVARAETLLTDAVRLRLRSDVPVGILLSGGLDSSLVAACAARSGSGKIKTFTMALPGSRLDESHHADVVARHFDTEHHVLEISEPSLGVLDELAPLIDEPIADSSLIPAYLVSKLTAEHVKVALGGDGGDELFGGYTDYTRACRDQTAWGWMPDSLFGALALAAKLPTGVRGRNRLAALRGGPFQSLIWGSPYFDPEARKRIFRREIVEELGDDFMEPEKFLLALFDAGGDPIDSMTRTHFGSILPDDFLVKVDRASMAVSLEMRTPFLDKELMEFAYSSVPSSLKVRDGKSRILERMLAEKLLPSELDKSRKQGFSVPVDSWLRNADDSVSLAGKQRIKSWINDTEVRNLEASQLRGRANGSRLFSLHMLDLFAVNMNLH